MGLGVGLFLIAIGAILAFAVTAHTSGVDIQTVGWILMAVGLAGVLLSLLLWSTFFGPGYWAHRGATQPEERRQPPPP